DPLGPRVERLEEVVGRAAAERRIGDPDVDDRRLRPRTVELEKETQLPLAAPQREARSGRAQHQMSVTAGAERFATAPPQPLRKRTTGPRASHRLRRRQPPSPRPR